LKLNGTHQFLVYADDANILGGSVHTIKKNAEALIVASKVIGLEVNADEIEYVFVSQERNVTVGRLIIVPLKGWKSSNIWEQP